MEWLPDVGLDQATVGELLLRVLNIRADAALSVVAILLALAVLRRSAARRRRRR